MALTLDATVGGLSSNSYVTRAEGDSYHECRLFVDDWTSASDANKDTALVWATSILDSHFDWAGTRFSIEQKLRWPRSGVLDRDGQLFDNDEIPQELKDAVSELARYLLTSDRTAESGTEGIKKLKVDVIELEFDKHDRTTTIPDEVYQMVVHLGRLKTVTAGGGQVAAVPLYRS